MPLPDFIEMVPMTGPVLADVTVPGSKSITNRALILAALADGEVRLTGALWSEDTQIMVDALRLLGFEIAVAEDAAEPCNRHLTVQGLGGRVPNAGTAESPLEIHVGNAGTAARFLGAFVCLAEGAVRLSGVDRMHVRPQGELFHSLRRMNYRIDSDNDLLPAVFHGTGPREMACSVSLQQSSQFASALLLSARQSRRPCVHQLRDAYPLQRLLRDVGLSWGQQRADRLEKTPAAKASGENVVEHAQMRHQVELLVNHADQRRELPAGSQVRQSVAIEADAAVVGPYDAGQQVEQGGLASAALPHHDQPFPGMELQVHRLQVLHDDGGPSIQGSEIPHVHNVPITQPAQKTGLVSHSPGNLLVLAPSPVQQLHRSNPGESIRMHDLCKVLFPIV